MSFPSLQDLHYFHCVAKNNSLARAAEELNVTTAALSKAMKRLEVSCNARLFKRTARSLHLSEAGEQFQQHAAQLLSQWRASQESLADISDTAKGKVVLSASIALARLKILPLLPKLKAAYPDIVLELRLEDQYIDLKNDDVDLLIRVGLLQNHDIIARPLMPLDMLYGASPQYLQVHGTPNKPHDLRQHRTIGFRRPGIKRLMPWQFQQNNEVFGLELNYDVIVNSPDAIQELILFDQGIGLLNRHLAQPFIDSGRLVPVLEDWMPPHELGIYLCYLDRQWMPKKQRAVIDFFLDALAYQANTQK